MQHAHRPGVSTVLLVIGMEKHIDVAGFPRKICVTPSFFQTKTTSKKLLEVSQQPVSGLSY
jgi:hypothetical protein